MFTSTLLSTSICLFVLADKPSLSGDGGDILEFQKFIMYYAGRGLDAKWTQNGKTAYEMDSNKPIIIVYHYAEMYNRFTKAGEEHEKRRS